MDDEQWMDLAIEAGQLREAMLSRACIEQAKGVIITIRRCTPDQAFRELAHVSQHRNIKLRDLATALVALTATAPGDNELTHSTPDQASYYATHLQDVVIDIWGADLP